MRTLFPAIVTVLSLVTAAAANGASPSPAQLRRGEALLIKDCGACHAVGATGASPVKDASAFRLLGRRYPIEALEEALAEGVMSGHPDMPEFSFDAADVGAIIGYLKSIQQR